MDDGFDTHGRGFGEQAADRFRLARTRDLLVLMIRAIREGFQVLRVLHRHIVPSRLKIFEWLPEPILVAYLRRLCKREAMEIAVVGHANAARDEAKHLVGEFMVMVRQTPVPTHAIDCLMPFLDPATPLMPDGSAQIPLRWWK